MTDSKLTALDALTTKDGTDLLYVVTDVAGTPTGKKAPVDTLVDYQDGGDVAGADRTIGNTDAYAFGIKTNNVERISVDSDGNIDIGTDTKSTLIRGGQYRPITTPNLTDNTYTITSDDYTILIDDDDVDVTGTVVVALPAVASSEGRLLNIKKIGNSQTVQLDGNLSELIDGSATIDITNQYDSVTIQCYSSSWWIL